MKLVNHLRILKWRLLGSKKPTNMFRKQQIISSIQKKSGIKVFVETGTFKGDMTVSQSRFFKKLYTIELGRDLYLESKERFRQFPNIAGYLGDSAKVMTTVINEISEPAIFWLDGHYSGGITAKGNLECPIYGELEAIFSKKGLKHIICIDDARLFNGTDDYPKIEEVKNFIKSKEVNYDFKIMDDMMIFKIL